MPLSLLPCPTGVPLLDFVLLCAVMVLLMSAATGIERFIASLLGIHQFSGRE
jgi:hypothetical protein